MASEVNLPRITPNQAIKYLHMFDMRPKTRKRAFYMQGEPGVAKSSAAKEYCRQRALRVANDWEANGRAEDANTLRDMAKDVDKSGLLITLLPNNRSPADIGGMQYINHEEGTTITLRPDWFPAKNLEGYPVVVFIDELTTVDSLMQAPLYAILQERHINGYFLDDMVQVITAGNGPDDGAISHSLSNAIVDRMWCFEVFLTAKAWLEDFAKPNNLHPAIIALLSNHPEYINTNKVRVDNDELAACTPRGLEDASELMFIFDEDRRNGNNMPVSERVSSLQSRLGNAAGALASNVYESSEFIVNLPQILENRDFKYVEKELLPKEEHEHYASQILLLSYAMSRAMDKQNLSRIYEVMTALYRRRMHEDILTGCMEILMAKTSELGLTMTMMNDKHFQAYEEIRASSGKGQAI